MPMVERMLIATHMRKLQLYVFFLFRSFSLKKGADSRSSSSTLLEREDSDLSKGGRLGEDNILITDNGVASGRIYTAM